LVDELVEKREKSLVELMGNAKVAYSVEKLVL
jgi:hypothetical protein